jgi:hypothetical protein
LNNQGQYEEDLEEKLYTAVNTELDNSINLNNLIKIDHISLILAIITIFAFIGISVIIDKELTYFIPISFIIITIISIYYTVKIFNLSQLNNFKDEFSHAKLIISTDCFVRNILPLLKSLSILMVLNTIFLFIFIFGLWDLKDIDNFFINATLNNLNFTSLTIEEKGLINEFIKAVKILYISSFIWLSVTLIVTTRLLERTKPPHFIFRNLIGFFNSINPKTFNLNLLKARLKNLFFRSFIKSNKGIILFYLMWVFVLSIFLLYKFVMLFISADLPSFSGNIAVKGIIIGIIQFTLLIFLLRYFNSSMIFNIGYEKIQNLLMIKSNVEFNRFCHSGEKKFEIDELITRYKLANLYKFKQKNILFFNNNLIFIGSNDINRDNIALIKKFINYEEETLEFNYSLKKLVASILLPGWFYLPLIFSSFFNLQSVSPAILYGFALFGVFLAIIIYHEWKES